MSGNPSSSIPDSSSVTMPSGPSSSIPERDEIHWEDDMVVDDPDPIHDQTAFSDSQLPDQRATVSSSLGLLVLCTEHESATSLLRGTNFTLASITTSRAMIPRPRPLPSGAR
ncbi:hypothetical protein LQW54_012184 [Pestalotiopsis sp. IQ-011]